MVHVRRLDEADAGQLWTLRLLALESEPQAFRETAAEHRRRTIAEMAERLRSDGDKSVVFGAFDEGKLVGMVGMYRNDPRRACIWGMFVSAEYRGTGVGRALMQAVIGFARTLPEMEAVELTVALSQTSARRLYVSCGFRPGVVSACGTEIPEDQEDLVLDLLQQR